MQKPQCFLCLVFELYFMNYVTVGLTKISIQTGTETSASTDATAELKICDGVNSCCETLELDNAGNDRAHGQFDYYSDSKLFPNCKQVGDQATDGQVLSPHLCPTSVIWNQKVGNSKI